MDMKPSETLERMRGMLTRLEQAVDMARSRREGVGPIMVGTVPSAESSLSTPPAPQMQARMNDPAPAPLPFPVPAPSGKPKARAKSLEEFDAAFKRLADRQAG